MQSKPLVASAAACLFGILGIFGILGTFLLAACGTSAQEGFAIYLTRDDVAPARMDSMSHVEPALEPLVSQADLVSYSGSNHTMQLTSVAVEKLQALQVPVTGKSFLVCVDGAPIYWGAFWTMYSSQSFEGVVIKLPLFEADENLVALELGYPGGDFAPAVDPRSDQKIFSSLEEAGKLTY